MNRLALIGVSHRRGGAAALETYRQALPPERLMAKGFNEFVPLVTCNRWDLALSLPKGVSLQEARIRLTPEGAGRPYGYGGEAALEQLCRVASSLDSLNPGEDQIMAQVREGFARAQRGGWAGPLTSFALNNALKTAKRVRREIDLAPANTSLFSLARPRLEMLLDRGAAVTVLGAGQMGTLAAKTLIQTGFDVTIVNRDVIRAQQLAAHLNVRALSLADFLDDPPAAQALICATSAKDLVSSALLSRVAGLRAVVDIGVPRNVVPGAAKGCELLDVDSLQAAGEKRRAELSAKLAQAEATVQEEVSAALSEWGERQLGPSIKRLRDWYLSTITDTLGDLAPEEAAKLAHKFAHVPIKGLRALTRDFGPEVARVYLSETGLLEDEAA